MSKDYASIHLNTNSGERVTACVIDGVHTVRVDIVLRDGDAPDSSAARHTAQRTAERVAAALDGRIFAVGRCMCYRGHNSNSGRCHARPLYTLPERKGVCGRCWDGCGHAADAAGAEGGHTG